MTAVYGIRNVSSDFIFYFIFIMYLCLFKRQNKVQCVTVGHSEATSLNSGVIKIYEGLCKVIPWRRCLWDYINSRVDLSRKHGGLRYITVLYHRWWRKARTCFLFKNIYIHNRTTFYCYDDEWWCSSSYFYSDGCGFQVPLGNSDIFLSKNSSTNIIITIFTSELAYIFSL